jgi:predicted metal-binding membrane protein
MVSSAPDLIGKILRHERAIIAAGVTLLVILCWSFLASGAGMPRMEMPMVPIGALVLMWWLMMLAMMLPSAAPVILLYARVREQHGAGSVASPWLFVLGYALVWLCFSAIAATVQRLTTTPAMTLADPRAASAVLIAAGIYQLSPIKDACLSNCRSPAQFLSRHWRPGVGGAIRLGLFHGAFCVGCCWLLMALLFVGGVMNFVWIVVLTVIVAIEKLVPRGEWFGRAAGLVLFAWGVVRLAL